MVSVPAIVNDRCYDLFIILQEDNIARMQSYDPAEIVTANFPDIFISRKVRNVILMYATEADLAHVQRMTQEGRTHAALKYLSRGYRWRPDCDRDESGGYEPLVGAPPDDTAP